MASQTPQERVEVLYSGNVQGVGFRYTTRHIAHRFPVAGFVRNLSDGRVQLVAEGTPAVLDAFLDEVAAEFDQHIRQAQQQRGPATGDFVEFRIAF